MARQITDAYLKSLMVPHRARVEVGDSAGAGAARPRQRTGRVSFVLYVHADAGRRVITFGHYPA